MLNTTFAQMQSDFAAHTGQDDVPPVLILECGIRNGVLWAVNQNLTFNAAYSQVFPMDVASNFACFNEALGELLDPYLYDLNEKVAQFSNKQYRLDGILGRCDNKNPTVVMRLCAYTTFVYESPKIWTSTKLFIKNNDICTAKVRITFSTCQH